MLTKHGWTLTIFIACLFTLSGLDVYLLYPITFLILGSLISKINLNNEDNEGRNATQVIANAGVAGVLSICYWVYPTTVFSLAIVVSFSVALSDTFSSELGKRYGGMPYSICTFSQTSHGLSGGISLLGTLGGFIGSGVISMLYYLHLSDLSNSVTILSFGFLGMLIDSIIGCALQAKYKTKQKISEKGIKADLISGFHMIDNNATNLLSITITVLLFIIMYSN